MSSSTTNKQAGLILYPHQSKFMADFLKEDAPPHQLLISPVGTGRTAVALALVADAAQNRPNARILIITPSILLEQFRYQLKREFNISNAEIINHQKFRELESKVPVGTSPWGSPLVALLSFRIAAQRNILESLKSTNWDLIIIDELHQLGANLGAGIEAMIDSGRAQRLLALTSLGLREYQSISEKLHTTTWSNDIASWDGSIIPRPPPLRLHLVNYRRGNDEAEFLTELQTFTSHQQQGAFSSLLTFAASSSSFALEKILRGTKERLSTPPLETLGQDSSAVSAEVATAAFEGDLPDDLLHTGPLTRNAETLKRITQLLEKPDSISSDEKLHALLAALAPLTASRTANSRICIVASFIATTSYLHSALTDEGYNVYTLNSAVSPNTRFDALDTFRSQGGTLIATQASLPGVDLRNIDAMFHYDLPNSEIWLHQRLAKVQAYGRSRPADVFFFRDQTNALSWEGNLLAQHQLILTNANN